MINASNASGTANETTETAYLDIRVEIRALTSSGAIEFSEVLACQKFSAGERRYEVWLPVVTKPAELRSFMTYDFPADFHGRSSM
jgi:hypothetical protein